MKFIGIDPGLKGGIAIIEEDGSLQLNPMPVIGEKEYDIYELKRLLRTCLENSYTVRSQRDGSEARILGDSGSIVVFERQHTLPGQGLTSSLKTGIGYGILLGLVAGLEIPHEVVWAKTWQKILFVGLPPDFDTKVKSEIVAKRLFPSADFRKSSRARKSADGLTDATCLAYYAKITHGKNI